MTERPADLGVGPPLITLPGNPPANPHITPQAFFFGPLRPQHPYLRTARYTA